MLPIKSMCLGLEALRSLSSDLMEDTANLLPKTDRHLFSKVPRERLQTFLVILSTSHKFAYIGWKLAWCK
jgi:hypothetical protein